MFSTAVMAVCSEKKSTNKSIETDLTKYITNYLEGVSIPKEVKSLVDKYNKCSTKKECRAREVARQEAFDQNKVGGGRKTGWVTKMFGMKENAENKESDDFYKALKDIPAPVTWSIEDIDRAYEQAKKIISPSSSKTNIYVEKGLGANYLSRVDSDAIVQIASQFNYLEAISGNSIATIDSYIDDHTQGPQASLEAASAAQHRRIAVLGGKLKNALVDVLPTASHTYYQNGYLELFRIQDPAVLKDVADHIKRNVRKLRILPQWVINEAENTKQLQVFSAAPSYQGQVAPQAGTLEAELCDILVSSQYEAIAKMAVIRLAHNPTRSKPIFVHFTLVGQGAFNNPLSVMKTAFKKVADIIRGFPHIYAVIHGYSESDQKKIKDLLDAEKIDFEVTTTRALRKGMD